MPVYKARVDSKYTVISNEVANSAMSLETKGLILYMQSKPDDWVFYKEVIMAECGIGKEKLKRIFNELVNNGHLAITQSHNEKGLFQRSDYTFFADPQQNPAFIRVSTVALKTVAGSPVNGKPSTTKEISKQSKEINKRDSFQLPSDLDLQAWDLWLDYRKQAKLKKYTNAPLSAGKQATRLINLAKESNSTQMEVVNHAIDKAWNGLYALPNKKPQPAVPVMNNFEGFEK